MPTAKKSKESTKSYAELSAELNDLLLWFESSELDVDEAIKKYEQAMTLIVQMESYLKTAQNRVREVAARFE